MALFRFMCSRCGLAATHIQSGDRGVTSFDTDEAVARCAEGKAAKLAEEVVSARVLQCADLKRALEEQRRPPAPRV